MNRASTRRALTGTLAGLLVLAPAAAFAQHTAPGAPTVQGQQRHPSTLIAPEGSGPENGVGEPSSLAVGDLREAEVINELGEPIGIVNQVVEGEGGRIYVVVALEDGRPTVFPIMLMGMHEDNLVVRGYGRDLLRAQRLDPEALSGFNEVHQARIVEIPRVPLVQ